MLEPSCESIVGYVKGLGPILLGSCLPVKFSRSQEGNGILERLSLLAIVDVLPSVGNVSVQDEGCSINRSLEG